MLVIDCALVEPAWGCRHRIRAQTEAEAMRLTVIHARSHGTEPTPELMTRSRALIRTEEATPPSGLAGDVGVAVRRRPHCLSGPRRSGRWRQREAAGSADREG